MRDCECKVWWLQRKGVAASPYRAPTLGNLQRADRSGRAAYSMRWELGSKCSVHQSSRVTAETVIEGQGERREGPLINKYISDAGYDLYYSLKH
jgi:hypothetical protein